MLLQTELSEATAPRLSFASCCSPPRLCIGAGGAGAQDDANWPKMSAKPKQKFNGCIFVPVDAVWTAVKSRQRKYQKVTQK